LLKGAIAANLSVEKVIAFVSKEEESAPKIVAVLVVKISKLQIYILKTKS
jgi:hypothetical protein